MAKIAITGIAGFIGFHLAQKLHADGHHIMTTMIQSLKRLGLENL